MENCIPKFWEGERESKKAFPTFGNGNGNGKLIPKLWERESEARIPENGREREFPLTPALSAWFVLNPEDSEKKTIKSIYFEFCRNFQAPSRCTSDDFKKLNLKNKLFLPMSGCFQQQLFGSKFDIMGSVPSSLQQVFM